MFQTDQGNTPHNNIQQNDTLFHKQSTPQNYQIKQNHNLFYNQSTPFNNNNTPNYSLSNSFTPTTQSLYQSKSQLSQTKSLSSQLKQLLTSDKPLCSGSNSAHTLCLNQKCSFRNPFICSVQDCKCVQHHQDCNQKRIDAFVRVLKQQQNTINKIQAMISNQVNNLIEEILKNKNQIFQKIRSLKWLGVDINLQDQYSLYKSDQIRQAELSSIFSSTINLNSKIFNSFWGLNKQIQNTINTDQLQNNLKQTSNKINLNIKDYFNDVYNFFSHQDSQKTQKVQKVQKINQKLVKNEQIKQQLFQLSGANTLKDNYVKINKIYWDLNSKSQQISVSGSHIKRTAEQYMNNLSLLSPSIDQMKGTNICWKIRIKKLKGWIGFGICLGEVVKQNKYTCELDHNELDHGCYMISTSEQKMIHKQTNGGKTYYRIKQGDMIIINYNKEENILIFTNPKYENSYKINVNKRNKAHNDAYYICACLQSIGDEIQFLGPVQTNLTNYTF